MPRSLPVLPMSFEQYHRMDHRLGWKHEYRDGAARLSPQESAVASLRRPLDLTEIPHPRLRDEEHLRLIHAKDQAAVVDLFVRASPLVLPALALAEVDSSQRDERAAMRTLVAEVFDPVESRFATTDSVQHPLVFGPENQPEPALQAIVDAAKRG